MNLKNINARILVDDLPKCYDFYTEVLGFEVTWGDREGAYVSFRTSGGEGPEFAIFKRGDMTMYAGYAHPAADGMKDAVVCCTNSDDIDAAYRELKEKGVELIGEPQTVPAWYMRCMYFRDPEGNLWEVSQGM